MKRLSVFMVTIAIILIFIAGCGNSTEVVKNNIRFALSVDRPAKAVSHGTRGICKIRAFRISSPFDTNYMIYKINGYSYDSDYYNRYLVSPSSMITEQTQKWLAKSGVFENVVDDSSRSDAQYLLEGTITGIYADFTNLGNFLSFIDIKVILIENRGFHNSIIFDKSYQVTSPLESSDPENIIKSMNASLEKILQSLEEDLQKI